MQNIFLVPFFCSLCPRKRRCGHMSIRNSKALLTPDKIHCMNEKGNAAAPKKCISLLQITSFNQKIRQNKTSTTRDKNTNVEMYIHTSIDIANTNKCELDQPFPKHFHTKWESNVFSVIFQIIPFQSGCLRVHKYGMSFHVFPLIYVSSNQFLIQWGFKLLKIQLNSLLALCYPLTPFLNEMGWLLNSFYRTL